MNMSFDVELSSCLDLFRVLWEVLLFYENAF